MFQNEEFSFKPVQDTQSKKFNTIITSFLFGMLGSFLVISVCFFVRPLGQGSM